MTSKGKLSKRDMATLNRAWAILSDWTQIVEDKAVAEDNEELYEDYTYTSAMNAVCGLCEFIGSYER
jgi:hypothetical protein